MSEVIAPENTVQTIDMAFEMLELRKNTNAPTELARFAHASVTTTCTEIPSRQLDLIETDSELMLWGTLSPEAWTQQAEWADANGAAAIEEITVPDKRGGDLSVWPARLPKAKRLQGAGVYVDFLYDEETRGYDGMFRVVVEKTGVSNSDEQKQLLETGFSIAARGKIFDPYTAADSELALKEATYREHYKIEPDKPLGDEQKLAVDRLQVETTATGRRHVVDPAKYVDERVVGVRHQFIRSDNIIGMLLDGELLSADERIMTGAFQSGRSTAADIRAGGSGSVYGYIQLESYSQASTAAPSVVFKKDVLNRLDVRAYADDAYGSRETEEPTEIDTYFHRPPIQKTVIRMENYDDRVHPDMYADQSSPVRELCFETSIGSEDIDKIIVPSEPTSWFEDTNWGRVLAAYSRNPSQLITTLQATTEANGVSAGIRFLTKDIGMPQEQAEYYLSGVGLTQMRDRLVKKLSVLGVTEVAGRPIEDVIVETPVA